MVDPDSHGHGRSKHSTFRLSKKLLFSPGASTFGPVRSENTLGSHTGVISFDKICSNNASNRDKNPITNIIANRPRRDYRDRDQYDRAVPDPALERT